MRVRWSARALAQLRAAHSYLQQENPPATNGFLDRVEKIAGLLGDFPRLGVQTDTEGVFVFPLAQYRYRIFYRIHRSNEIQILRIRHNARRP